MAVTLPISVFVSEIGAVESVERYWTKVQYTSTTVPVYCPIKVFELRVGYSDEEIKSEKEKNTMRS